MSFITTRDLFIDAARMVAKRMKIIHPRPLLMRLDFEDGVHLFTHGAKPNLNTIGVGKIARDKDLTVRVLENLGLPTPPSHFVELTREKFAKADDITQTAEYKALDAFAQRVGYPIFLKPNQGSQGCNVFCVPDEDKLKNIVGSLIKRAPGYFIAQEASVGEEYRIVVVQGEIQLAYYRRPLSVVGDGVATIQHLVDRQNRWLQKRGRHTNLKSNSDKIKMHLASQGLRLDSVLPMGDVVTVLSNRNLSDGSEPVECTQMIREKYGALCRDVYERGGVDYCGLDLIEDIRSGQIKPVIIEINSSPGYKHFIRSAPENPPLVRSVFIEAIHASHRKQVLLHSAYRPSVYLLTSTTPPQPPHAALLIQG